SSASGHIRSSLHRFQCPSWVPIVSQALRVFRLSFAIRAIIHRARLPRRATLALCIGLPCTHAADAQTISGKVVNEGDRRVVTGAIVVLLDSSGRTVASRLAEDSGTFRFTAPGAGRYAIRVERVGFRSTVSAPILVRE